jgi:antitoxin HicB
MRKPKITKIKTIKEAMALHYPIEILPFDSENGIMYEACIPQLGRYRFTGIGETSDEAIESLNKIKKEIFIQMLEEGKEIPIPDDPDEDFSGRFVLRMSKDLHKELVFSARDKDISLNKHINDILDKWKHCSDSTEFDAYKNQAIESVKKGIEKAFSHYIDNDEGFG